MLNMLETLVIDLVFKLFIKLTIGFSLGLAVVAILAFIGYVSNQY